MNPERGYLHFVQTRHPKMWALIEKTARDSGLIFIDEANDAITASNRLLWTNPILHDCLATLVDQWAMEEAQNAPNPLMQLLSSSPESAS
ncbi:hypothetical protein [Magnetofaba australis]|uniref:Uncharacterized protein n=1 Tax=Magnetofaba australis IT-1 TaxID=1434232 RepID=A0A1Y2K2R9_9PROT|nr:hypothetical protein [Magnetofaba australis]OSM01886.1 hypothetical protein MAIT1_01942 [Magnetofaba australis IT-1]